MIENQIINRHPTTIDQARQLFVDPNDPSSAEKLASLSSMAIGAMAQIYAHGGDLEQMDPETRQWLMGSQEDVNTLRSVMGDILRSESQTRRFDNRFMGQIHPQGNIGGIVSNLIGAYMNNNLIVNEVSQSEQTMERESIAWMAKMLGYDPKTASGNIVTGGTTANYAALTVARNKILRDEYKDMGMRNPLRRIRSDIAPIYVLASKWKHYSIDKACDMLNLGLLTLPSDNFKVDPEKIEAAIIGLRKKGNHIAAIVGLAGETETGMVEDLEALAYIANKYGVFFHVDAAYGGPFILSRQERLFKGINKADSITIDPHKLLYVPYSAGAFLFKDKEDHNLLATNTRYLGEVASTIEGSRGTGGTIATFATIQLFGETGLKALANHTLDLAEHAYNRVSNSEVLRPIHKPELNTMLIALTDKTKARMTQKGLKPELMEEIIKAAKDDLDQRHPNDPYISRNSDVDLDKEHNFNFSGFRYIGMHPFTTNLDVDSAIAQLERKLNSIIENPQRIYEIRRKFEEKMANK